MDVINRKNKVCEPWQNFTGKINFFLLRSPGSPGTPKKYFFLDVILKLKYLFFSVTYFTFFK